MTWILFTLLAAFSQSWRNAFQSRLSQTLSVTGVVLARFLWAPPLAGIYLLLLYWIEPVKLPEFTFYSYVFMLLIAMMQITATGLMVILFKQKNFAIGAGLAKNEAPIAALLGLLFFGTSLSLFGWLGVLLGTIAVFILSCPKGIGEISLKTLLLGLACSSCFALTSLWMREMTLTIELPFLHRSAWVLLIVISLQTLILSVYLGLKEADTLKAMFVRPKLVMMTSFVGFMGSVGWVTAMSLQIVPLVKTLGQIEVVFTLLISFFWLKEKLRAKDIMALVLIMLASVLVIWNA